jgi:hypothetical protein
VQDVELVVEKEPTLHATHLVAGFASMSAVPGKQFTHFVAFAGLYEPGKQATHGVAPFESVSAVPAVHAVHVVAAGTEK